MKIWYANGTVSIAAIIAAAEAGLEPELIAVDFASAAQTKPEYLSINPKGRVPALATDQGILTETGAVLEYIASKAPDAGLVPDNPWEAAQMRAAMHYLAATMHVNHAHKMRGRRWASAESSYADMKANVTRTMNESCAYVENEMLAGPWVLGDQYSVADIHLFVVTSWAPGDGVDLSDYPRLAAHFAAMQMRPAVASVIEQGFLPQIGA